MRIPILTNAIDRRVAQLVAAERGKTIPENYEGSRGWDYLWGLVSKWTKGWVSSSTVFNEMTDMELEQCFATHPIVHACVAKFMRTAASCRFEVGQWKDEETWEPLKTAHPTLELLEHPNNQYTRVDFQQYCASRFMLTGCSYIAKLRNGGRKLGQLWPLPTSWVTPQKGNGTQLISAYKIANASGQQWGKPVLPEDMMVSRLIDPASTYGHVSPLNAAFRDLRMDTERENYLGEMLRNMKLPGMVVRPKGRNFTPDQKADAQLTLDERVGYGKRGNALILGVDSEVDIVNPLADLDWPGLCALIETRVCAALGTPPIIIGSRAGLDRATYSNYEQAIKAYFQGTMVPYWDLLAAVYTLHLLFNEGETRLEYRARYDELPECQEDMNKKAERVVKLVTGQVLTRDEGREELGFDPQPDWEPPAQPPPPLDPNKDPNNFPKKKKQEDDDDDED